MALFEHGTAAIEELRDAIAAVDEWTSSDKRPSDLAPPEHRRQPRQPRGPATALPLRDDEPAHAYADEARALALLIGSLRFGFARDLPSSLKLDAALPAVTVLLGVDPARATALTVEPNDRWFQLITLNRDAPRAARPGRGASSRSARCARFARPIKPTTR